MAAHFVIFMAFSILLLPLSVFLLEEDNPYDKLILFFGFLVASMFVVCAAKSMIEISLMP